MARRRDYVSKKSLYVLAVVTLIVLDASGQQLVNDPFAYEVGPLAVQSNGSWEEGAGTAGLINVVEGSLAFAGYGSEEDNRVELVGSEGFSLVMRRFGVQASGTIYAAVLLNVGQGVPGFQTSRFMAFGLTPRLAELVVFGDGGDESTFALCVNKTNAFAGPCSQTLTPGTTYLVVVAYTFNGGSDENDVVKLWIDPDLSQPEPAPDLEHQQGTDAAAIDRVVLEQNDDLTQVAVDDLRVAASWDELGADAANIPPGQPVLTEPQNGITQTLLGDPATPFVAAWTAVTDPDGDPVAYTWQLSADGFATLLLDEDVGGATRYETTFGALDALLAGAGVEAGGSLDLEHRVLAADGTAASASATFSLTLVRDVATAVEADSHVPDAFRLSPVYPNPFNPSARFTLEVRQSQRVRVAVFDVLGREAAVLYDGALTPGSYPFLFAAGGLSGGLYVIRATGETLTVTRRAVLVK